MKPTLGVIGAGRMGTAIATTFSSAGYDTIVWNRTRSKLEPLAKAGARIAESVRDVASAADILFLIVTDYAVTEELLRPAEVTRALRDKTLVQLASGSPRLAREAEAWARSHAIRYLNGAIMATPPVVGKPECTILFAGDRELFESVKEPLLLLGPSSSFVGEDVGHASALDGALLSSLWGTLYGTLLGAAICRAAALPLESYAEYLKAVTPIVEAGALDLIDRVRTSRFSGHDADATIDVHHGAARYLVELCAEHGIDPTLAHAFERAMARAVAAGHGQDDFAHLIAQLTPHPTP